MYFLFTSYKTVHNKVFFKFNYILFYNEHISKFKKHNVALYFSSEYVNYCIMPEFNSLPNILLRWEIRIVLGAFKCVTPQQ